MISIQEYAKRRARLMEQLPKDALVIVRAAPVVMRTESAEYPYRQANAFLYLCGFPEPHATLVLTQNHSILFCQDKNPEKEIWTGRIIGPEKAKNQFGLDETFSNHLLDSKLSALKKDKLDQSTEASKLLAEMRLIKSDAEIELMKKAASISARAHNAAREYLEPGMNEAELAAFYEYEFKKNGGTGLAYECIVGGGENACILHYRENNQMLKSGDLVLIDAACEFEGYAADITRTYPVNGCFTEPQRQIYELVLKAQKNAIQMVKPGLVYEALQEQVARELTEGLINLGLLKGDLEQLISSKAYRQFYMHSSGHWLGLDVHDVGAYKINDESRKLQENMVLTVEPGIYIAASQDVDPRWHNIGIRIEDDVQVTQAGACVLSAEALK